MMKPNKTNLLGFHHRGYSTRLCCKCLLARLVYYTVCLTNCQSDHKLHPLVEASYLQWFFSLRLEITAWNGQTPAEMKKHQRKVAMENSSTGDWWLFFLLPFSGKSDQRKDFFSVARARSSAPFQIHLPASTCLPYLPRWLVCGSKVGWTRTLGTHQSASLRLAASC